MDTSLWELAGHEFGVKPDVEKDCYKSMDELQKRKNRIEHKLAKKHLKNGSIILYDITNTWLEGEYKNSSIVKYGKAKGGKKGYKQVAIGLLTDEKGCPVGVEIFKGNTSDQSTVIEQIKKLSKKYEIKHATFVGDRGMLTRKRISEIDSNYFKTITALTHLELKSIIEKENIQLDLFDEMDITEIIDSENKEWRYMLCKNEREMTKERNTREALIQKVEKLLIEKAAVNRKRNKQKVCASIGRIFERNKIEKFFNWEVDDNGALFWSRKDEIIESEKLLDGCYVIKTNASKSMNKQEVVEAYRGLQKVEQAFRNMKTVVLELRPIHHKLDDRIKSHIFVVMLAYYLQWHMMQKLKPLFESDGKRDERRWSFEIVINRLKSITKHNKTLKGVIVGEGISKPDKEQRRILDLLEIKM
jgi:transposase